MIYNEIIQIVRDDSLNLDKVLDETLDLSSSKNNPIIPIIKEFLSYKGKRIRSVLSFLMLRACGAEVSELHYKLVLAVELIHNASLIHDDIIDCSLLRRGKKTLSFDYDSKLAVLAGDFLIAEVLKMLFDIQNEKIRKTFSYSVSSLVNGELKQYFNRFKVISIEDYVEKSKNKTAKLFETALVSCALVSDLKENETEKIRDFAINFGTAFQIKNDIENFEDKSFEDIENGDYSAPVIYYAQDVSKNKEINFHNAKLLVKQIRETNAIQKSKNLVGSFLDSAIENIDFLEDNQYKRALKEICYLYKND